jgi:UPF0716 protein FxsA
MPLLFLLFIVVPIAELYVIIQVGQAIGILPTIALLLLDSIVGTWLLRQQGRVAWRRFNAALQAGRPPAQETIDGGLILVGGAFLLTPGFLSDILGVILLLPPTRAVVRRLLARRFLGRMTAGMARGATARFGAPAGTRPPRDYDIDGTAHDV